jgi:uncharacterized protein (TIGR00369 family)
MSARPSGTEVPFVAGGPESVFRVGPVIACGDVFRGTMATGGWVLGPDGHPSCGALGVLIDDVLGYPVVAARPAGCWAVSTEISVDFCAPVPPGDAGLEAESRVVHRDSSGGLAEARVLDAAGRVIASGRQRLRFIPGTPAALAPGGPGSGAPAGPPGQAPALDQLGATMSPTADGAVLHLPLGPAVANPMGTLHGGIMFCATELAGHAAVQRPGSFLSTASVHISYLRPGPVVGRVTFEAVTLHRGRTLAVSQVAGRNEAGKVCTLATVTCHRAGS